MGKECGAWVSRRLWGGGNTSPLKTTAWEAMKTSAKNHVSNDCVIDERTNTYRALSRNRPPRDPLGPGKLHGRAPRSHGPDRNSCCHSNSEFPRWRLAVKVKKAV